MDGLEVIRLRADDKKLDLAHRRLANQHLSGDRFSDPASVVRHFGAMQAQEFAVAKWSVGQRANGLDDGAVQSAIDRGDVLRTHALRPTWHFVAAEDIGWIQALTGPRVHAVTAYYYRQHGLDADLIRKSNRVITRALAGGNQMTRVEIAHALQASGMEASGTRLAHIVMHAELDGIIANGAMRGKQHTYALISERAPNQRQMSHDEALAELTLRYFTSHGPATVKDFSWWSSLTITSIRRGIAMAGGALATEEVDGVQYVFAPSTPRRREPSPHAHVLQAFDEYSVAYTQSRPLTNVSGLQIDPPGDTTLAHPIVLDSQVVGFWRRIVERDRVVVRPVTARPLTALEKSAIEQAFIEYAKFAGVPVTVAWPQ
jgi:hypothetical protein